MNLADILLPKPRYSTPAGEERAERAENQQLQVLRSPPAEAERGGKGAGADIRPNPPAGAGTESRTATAFPPNPPNPPALRADIEKPVPVTLEYFREQSVELLPEDLAFLRWHLPKDTARRNSYIAQYVAVWLDAMRGEPTGHRKANQGRRAANQWLWQVVVR